MNENECMDMEEANKVLDRIQSNLEMLIEIKKHRRCNNKKWK